METSGRVTGVRTETSYGTGNGTTGNGTSNQGVTAVRTETGGGLVGGGLVFGPERMSELRAVFNTIDRNHDGSIQVRIFN